MTSADHRVRFSVDLVLLAASSAVTGFSSLGCTDCSGQPRLRPVAIGAAEPVIVTATIPQGTTQMTWHCWSSANGPRVDRRRASLVWYVPGTALANTDIDVYLHIGSTGTRRMLDTSCTSEMCPIASDGVADEPCGDVGGICSTLVWDVDLEVANAAVIPAQGLATEFRLDASFFTLARSGSGDLNQPQPADADISDINIDMGCALVTP